MYMKYYNLWRDYDLLATIISNTGLLVFFIWYEMFMAKHVHTRDPEQWPHAMDDPYNAEPSNNIVRMLVFFSTLCSLFCLF